MSPRRAGGARDNAPCIDFAVMWAGKKRALPVLTADDAVLLKLMALLVWLTDIAYGYGLLILQKLHRRAYRAAFSSALRRLALTYTVCMVA